MLRLFVRVCAFQPVCHMFLLIILLQKLESSIEDGETDLCVYEPRPRTSAADGHGNPLIMEEVHGLNCCASCDLCILVTRGQSNLTEGRIVPSKIHDPL